MTRSYSAGYYSYKWAEVLSADAFSAFEDAGLDNPAAVADVGRRFRRTVLGLGGGRAPADVFADFRGRQFFFFSGAFLTFVLACIGCGRRARGRACSSARPRGSLRVRRLPR